jgi:RNA polymerase sigma-70 factor (ECF subfamily)
VSAVAPASLGTARPQSVDATRLLYERHSGRIFGYCLSLLHSREDAEDAVQQTFLNAQTGLRRGVVPEYELAWLFKIAKNVCSNRRASAWRRGRVETARDLDLLQDVVASPERQEELSIAELTRALTGIPERQRRALLLREWKGLSYVEIGAQLGVSVAAVETLLFRARRSLAEELEQTGTSRRVGALASLVSLLRWFVKGGAAPVKIAAATATVAALAVAPVVVRGHDQTPAPVLQQHVGSAPAAVSGKGTLHRTAPNRTRGVIADPRVAPTVPASTSNVSAPSAAAPAPPRHSSPQVVPAAPAAPPVVVPALDVPQPPISLPQLPVTVPDLSLPAVQLPLALPNLPVDLPKPDLSKLLP